jgi:hypothetical protein
MRVSHQNDALHRDLLSSLIYERSPDTANKLRFVVITGIDRDHPAWYRLLIAPNEEAMVMLVIGETQFAVSNLFSKNPILFDQVSDGMLLMPVQPSRNGSEDEEEGRQKRRHSEILPSVAAAAFPCLSRGSSF